MEGILKCAKMHACHRDVLQEIACSAYCSVFISPFLLTLCARDGYVDTPPASREEAKMRRITWGQIWSILATLENACTEKEHRSQTSFQIFIFSNLELFRKSSKHWLNKIWTHDPKFTKRYPTQRQNRTRKPVQSEFSSFQETRRGKESNKSEQECP